jgi:phosphate:Na+ symporter
VFNLLTAIVLIPFADWLVKLSLLVVKDEKEKGHRFPELYTLDANLYISPAVAVAEGAKAVAAMGNLARENFQRGCKVLNKHDPVLISEIEVVEDNLDRFADRADNFMIGLSKVIETEGDDLELDMLMQAVPSFERIGDYATNMVELAERLQAESSCFSESAKRELDIMCTAVNEILEITVNAFTNSDNEEAKAIEPLEETIDDMVMILRDRHTKRLKSGACSISSGLVFMEALTHFERASDHCSAVAVMMLARNNEAILHNHYDYLREIHAGNDEYYRNERNRRREQYITALKAVQ